MIRAFRPDDMPALKKIHEVQGHPYPLPDLTSQQFAGIVVAVDENDVPIQAIAARKTVEVYFLGDPTWKTPGWRLETFRRLHLAAHEAMLALGYEDANCWIPPSVEKAFGRRLQKIFGWKRSIWQSFSKEL